MGNGVERTDGYHRGYDMRRSDVKSVQAVDNLATDINGRIGLAFEQHYVNGPKIVPDELAPQPEAEVGEGFERRLTEVKPLIEGELTRLFAERLPAESAAQVLSDIFQQKIESPVLTLNLKNLGISGPRTRRQPVMQWQGETEKRRDEFLYRVRRMAEAHVESLFPQLLASVNIDEIKYRSPSGDLYDQLGIGEVAFIGDYFQIKITRSHGRGR